MISAGDVLQRTLQRTPTDGSDNCSTRNAAANAAPEDGLVSAGAKSALSAELPHTGLESVGSKLRIWLARVGAASPYPRSRNEIPVHSTRYRVHAVRHPTRSSFYLGGVE